MAQIIREIRVDVSQPNVFQAIVAKQLDCNSRFLKITLVDFGVKIEVPKTAKVTINANRPDGKSDSFMGVANNDGTITVPLAQWMLEVAGELKCDVSVINTTDNKRLTSTDFYVNVQEAANKSTDISENPDGEIRVITPTQKIDENSSDDEYPSAKAVYELDNITATASGKAITIDSAKAPLQNLKLYGKTTQDGTLGENILPYPYTTKTIDGVTFTDLGDGRLQVKGTATNDATLTLLNKVDIQLIVGRLYRIQGIDLPGVELISIAEIQYVNVVPVAEVLTEGGDFKAVKESNQVTVKIAITGGTTYDCIIHPQLILAEAPLVSVGDSGSFEVGVYGKNLLEVTATTQTINGITFTINADKSITVNGTASATAQLRFCEVPFIPKGEYIISGNPTKVSGVEYYFKATGEGWIQSVGEQKRTYENDTSAFGLISISNGITVNNLTFYPMLRKAEITDSTYEPCNKQTLTMPYKLESYGTDYYKNEVDFAKGIKLEKVKTITVNGSEAWYWNDTVKGFYFYPKNYGIMPIRDSGISTHFPQKINEDLCFFVSGGQHQITIYDFNGKWANLDAFKTWLSQNNVTFVLPLQTPIETPLTETELNAYRQLYTNKGTTNILNNDGADMSVTYYINKPNAQAIGNIHSQVNNDYFKLQQAIISLGGSTL